MHALKPTLSVLKMVPLTESVIIPFVTNFLVGNGEDRRFEPSAEIEKGATAMFDELARTAPVLARLRR